MLSIKQWYFCRNIIGNLTASLYNFFHAFKIYEIKLPLYIFPYTKFLSKEKRYLYAIILQYPLSHLGLLLLLDFYYNYCEYS